MRANPRSRSAVMRVAERTDAAASPARGAFMTRLNLLLFSRCCQQHLPGARLVRRAPAVRGARQGASPRSDARARQRTPEGRAAGAGHAAAGREDRARAARDAQRDAGGHAVRRTGAARGVRPPAAPDERHRGACTMQGAARRRTCAASTTRAARCWRRRRRRGARKFLVALVGMGFCVLARARGLRAGRRHAVLPEAGRDPLRAHARPAGQPRPHPRPQRPDAGGQRAGALAVGDPEGLRGRHARRSASWPSCSA